MIVLRSILYIPQVSTRGFQLVGLTWQWGLVVGQLVLYLVAAELYKLAKRMFYHRRAARSRENPVEALERRLGKKFHVAYTIDV
jgi:P-type Na+/K+ transporter